MSITRIQNKFARKCKFLIFNSNFHRNLVGKLAVGRLAALFEQKQPTANLPTANQISMKIEKKTYALHTRVNLLRTP
jgi:hypothetical protein